MKSDKYWKQRALNRLAESEKHSEKYIKRIQNIYEQAYRNINKELHSIYKNYAEETGLNTQKLKELLTRSETEKEWQQMQKQGLDKYVLNNYKSRITRMEQLQAQIYAKAKLIYSKEELQQRMCYKGIINNNYYKVMYDTQIGTGFNFAFSTIDNNLIDALLNEKWSGKNYSERIWGNTDILAENLSQILGGALLSGQGIQKTAKQIRERFKVSKYYSERLIRTETNHFNNTADAIACKELGAEKYVFMATLDTRTSDICQKYDHKVFKYSALKEGVNFPPLHPNCRSTTRAYIDKEFEKHLHRRAEIFKQGQYGNIKNVNYKKYKEVYAPEYEKPKKKVAETANNTIKYINNTNTYKNLIKENIIYNKVRKLTKTLSSDKIISKISGGDNTKGSCVSVGLAYAGNKLGFDVLDFRGGASRSYFSTRYLTKNMYDELGIKVTTASNTNDYKAFNELMTHVKTNKEYLLHIGRHCSVIRRNDKNILEYLELQSPLKNGYVEFKTDTLKNRFGCRKSHSTLGTKYNVDSLLVNIDDIKVNKKGFGEVLGFINTAPENQKKGSGGHVK